MCQRGFIAVERGEIMSSENILLQLVSECATLRELIQENTREDKRREEILREELRVLRERVLILEEIRGESVREERSGVRKRKTNFPPSLEDVVAYCLEKGFDAGLARKIFDYYEAGKWHDSEGKPVKSWKQKCLAVWFPNAESTMRRYKKDEEGLSWLK